MSSPTSASSSEGGGEGTTATSPMSPSKWTEQELRARISVLEQAVQERNKKIENIQRELRVAQSKARITDELMSEVKVLRARIAAGEGSGAGGINNTSPTSAATGEQQQQQQNSKEQQNQNSSSSMSSAGSSLGGETEIEKLRRMLNSTSAPSPIEISGVTGNSEFGLPPTEEEEIEEVMARAKDENAVESVEERLMRERLEKLMAKK